MFIRGSRGSRKGARSGGGTRRRRVEACAVADHEGACFVFTTVACRERIVRGWKRRERFVRREREKKGSRGGLRGGGGGERETRM